MSWILEDHERATLASVSHNKFKRDVIAHARRKMVFDQDISDVDYKKIADIVFGRVHAFLGQHPQAIYDSYVLMMIVYFVRGTEQVEGEHMQATLQNQRIGINTRVRVAYDLTKIFMQEFS